MKDQIINFPKQLSEGYSLAANTGSNYKNNPIKNIIVAGMGGSGLPSNILETVKNHIGLSTPVYPHKTYGLPAEASKSSLVIAISYSGNTEEALSSYSNALEKNIPTIAITTGGELAETAEQNNLPLILLPKGLQPRMALGYQFSALLRIIENAGLIESQKENIEDAAKMDSEKYRATAEDVAKNIANTTPIVYSSSELEKLAYILKIQLNENAKRHAFYNSFPEMNHNELEGYEAKNNGFSSIFLRTEQDNKRVLERMDLAKNLLLEKNYPVYTIDFSENNIYNKVFSIVLFGYWLSYSVAINNNIEPESVELIEEFKKLLK